MRKQFTKDGGNIDQFLQEYLKVRVKYYENETA